MDSFFGKAALSLQEHNASSNLYLSGHPGGSAGVAPVKDVMQLLPEFVLPIQSGNIFSVEIYTYICTHMHVFMYISICIYICVHTQLVYTTGHH